MSETAGHAEDLGEEGFWRELGEAMAREQPGETTEGMWTSSLSNMTSLRRYT